MSTDNPYGQRASNLVGPDKLVQLNDALRALDAAENEAQLLARAGVDQTDNLQKITAQRAQILQFKSVYFPGQ